MPATAPARWVPPPSIASCVPRSAGPRPPGWPTACPGTASPRTPAQATQFNHMAQKIVFASFSEPICVPQTVGHWLCVYLSEAISSALFQAMS